MLRAASISAQGQTGKLLDGILLVASAIADLFAVATILATVVKQDPLLIFLITVAAIAFARAVRRPMVARNLSRASVLIIFGASLVLVVVAWSLLASSGITPIKVTIVDPRDDGSVTMRYLVKGTVSDPNDTVHVILHPLSVSDMWVHRPTIVDNEGNWQVSAYFGTETLGIGERYELIALATSDNFLVAWATGNWLRDGQKLMGIPRKSNKSNVVTVTRSR
jgi:hypothetical protein